MAVLELVQRQPDWLSALGVAMTRPPGVPERRGGEDPWQEGERERPRRVSDDLAWLRQAMDEPQNCGLRDLEDTAAVGAWVPDKPASARLCRLRDRHVLEAAGFLLHEESDEDADRLSAA
jgi:hypothetical protein